MPAGGGDPDGFRSVAWRLTYDTGAPGPDGTPVDILRDFYLPALSRATAYDRVAGYFRSTSLAAAAQGFEAFVRHQGRIRLVVGADLDPADVAAILQGEAARRDAALLAALGLPEDWPEDVREGVALLAWMVARRRLDLRVAFRVHARSGRPLTANSVADGYVHMKFGVLRDAQGDRLYLSGSLNELRTALHLNAENIDVHCSWRGEDAAARVADAEHRFALLWADENAAMRVMPLPEAVRQRLIEFAKPPPLRQPEKTAEPGGFAEGVRDLAARTAPLCITARRPASAERAGGRDRDCTDRAMAAPGRRRPPIDRQLSVLVAALRRGRSGQDDRSRLGPAVALPLRHCQTDPDRSTGEPDPAVAARNGVEISNAVRPRAVGHTFAPRIYPARQKRPSGGVVMRARFGDRFDRASGAAGPARGVAPGAAF